MGLFDFFKKNSSRDLIARYGLNNWWKSLSKDERKIIQSVYNIYDTTREGVYSVTKRYDEDLGLLRGMLNSLKNTEHYNVAKKIMIKADSLAKNVKDITNAHFYYMDKMHIHYHNRVSSPDALNETIKTCKEGIAISRETAKKFLLEKTERLESLIVSEKRIIKEIPALREERTKEIQEYEKELADIKSNPYPNVPAGIIPMNFCFQQLCIIYDKQGKYEEVIQTAEQAKVDGWDGDWDKRIEKAKAKLNKRK